MEWNGICIVCGLGRQRPLDLEFEKINITTSQTTYYGAVYEMNVSDMGRVWRCGRCGRSSAPSGRVGNYFGSVNPPCLWGSSAQPGLNRPPRLPRQGLSHFFLHCTSNPSRVASRPLSPASRCSSTSNWFRNTMSAAAYRLETPRPRPPPPPLRHPSPRTSVHINTQSNQTLLYDLPSSPPPTSPTYSKPPASPASPSFPGGRARGRRGGRTGPTPPARNRSSTPLGVSQSDLEKFTDYCRSWYATYLPSLFLPFTTLDRYFDQDEAAGRVMTQTLANVAPSQRALYSRLQASVRSAYHANVNARRHAEFQAHICATQPGGSLMPHSRADPTGPIARKERLERFDRFVRTWCTMGMPGTKPFFEALWAVMRLQVLPEQLGGAGRNKVRWELDDAVFKEAAYVSSAFYLAYLYLA